MKSKFNKLYYNDLKRKFGKWFTATRFVVISFMIIILIGALLLMLPCSTKDVRLSFTDALFTATSATCVTGLAVVNTYATFSVFGQIVLLLLIQIGGLGFMTLTSSIYLLLGRRISLQYKINLKENNSQDNFSELKILTINIVKFTAIIEAIGAILLTIGFSKYMSVGQAIWSGIFHSVSAFCNAGFDLIYFGGGSMMAFSDNAFILLTLACLIIIGGLGFLVISDIIKVHKWRKLRLHSKVVLMMTGALLLGGTIFILAADYDNPLTLGAGDFGYKLLNAFFQSTTARTAGFNSISQSDMSDLSKLTTMLLMFIGACPGSTGGGIKTTTLFILISGVVATARQKKEIVVDMRTISQETVYKASTVITMALSIMILSTMALLLTEKNMTGIELLFEQISAYATVGLTLGVTADLSLISKYVLMINMFLGRVGITTFLIAFTRSRRNENSIKYQETNILM